MISENVDKNFFKFVLHQTQHPLYNVETKDEILILPPRVQPSSREGTRGQRLVINTRLSCYVYNKGNDIIIFYYSALDWVEKFKVNRFVVRDETRAKERKELENDQENNDNLRNKENLEGAKRHRCVCVPRGWRPGIIKLCWWPANWEQRTEPGSGMGKQKHFDSWFYASEENREKNISIEHYLTVVLKVISCTASIHTMGIFLPSFWKMAFYVQTK